MELNGEKSVQKSSKGHLEKTKWPSVCTRTFRCCLPLRPAHPSWNCRKAKQTSLFSRSKKSTPCIIMKCTMKFRLL